MATYTVDQVISGIPELDVGDDVYAKPLPLDTDWLTDNILGEPTVGTTIYTMAAASLDTTITYVVYVNGWSATFTVDVGSDVNQINATAHGVIEGTRVYFKGASLPSALTAGKPYWAINVLTDSFEVEETQSSGVPVNLGSNGSGSLTFTATNKRSSTDEDIGTLQSDQSSLVGEGELTSIAAQITLTYNVVLSIDKVRKLLTNRREPSTISSTVTRYTVYEDDGTTTAFQVDFTTTTGALAVV